MGSVGMITVLYFAFLVASEPFVRGSPPRVRIAERYGMKHIVDATPSNVNQFS